MNLIERDLPDALTVTPPTLEVKDLKTQFFTDEGVVRAVDGVSFSVGQGETLGIVGESGSGKSVTALSLMRLLDEPARIVSGSILFQGRDVLKMSATELRALRGGGMAMVFQNPMTSLNPVLRIARQIEETMTVRGRYSGHEARGRALSLLERMGISGPREAIRRYPHQFSGGMRQRVALAIGMSNEPALLICDEPTTALDVTIQAQILELLLALNRDYGTSIILISHDLGVIARVCSRVIVMYAGEAVEEGPAEKVLTDPKHPYSWALINAVPRLAQTPAGRKQLTAIGGAPPDPLAESKGCRFAPRCPFRIERCAEHPSLLDLGDGRKARCWVTQAGATLSAPPPEVKIASARTPETDARPARPPLLDVRGLFKHYPLGRRGLFEPRRAVRAVDGVDLTVRSRETVGLVGESGCGKSTLARLLIRIQRPDAGSICFGGEEIAQASNAQIRPLRKRMQMVFQDPYSSLNARMTVGEILAEPLRFHGITKGGPETREKVRELLATVRLDPKSAARYPHEFSGGQRQRIAIARALSVRPDFIIADEPVSALDVNIQAQVLNLMSDLQQEFGLSYLFIAHDLAVVRHISDRVLVLYLGKLMEAAPSASLFDTPLHPYTRYLISAVPLTDPAAEKRRQHLQMRGEPPSAASPPSGCRFRTRCPIARAVCSEAEPALTEYRPGHFAACHFAGEF